MNIKGIKTQLSEELRREARIRMRIKVVTIFVAIMFGIVVVRALELHCFTDKGLNWIASKQRSAVVPQSQRRGRILDRAGKELAVSLPVPSIYADPRAVKLTDAEMTELASLLGMKKDVLQAKLKSPKKFVWLKRKVDRELLERLKDFTGIFSIEEANRLYPNGELASQLLGAVGMDSDPLGGLELASNKFLSSKKIDAVYRRDARGKFYFSPVAYQEQDDVSDLYLTIDKNIQFAAENSLRKAVQAANARGGTVVVMDVDSGAILAMANMPGFDPNNYSKYPQDNWRNRAITDSIEPGSTFKVLIAAAGLDSGAVTPDTKYDCENGAIKVGNAVLHDHDPYSVLSVVDIIKKSSNIGALKIARDIGKERLFEYLKKFGIGNRTGIDYPGEVGGIVRPVASLQPVEFATIAFGQGISVTPMQMTAAFASIANGGKLMRPYIIDHVVNNQGMTILRSTPNVISNPINEASARTTISMMEGVVGEGGTGTKAASREYPVAGKTGTAQKVSEGSRGYAHGKYYASFVGIAPSDKPKIVVFVGLDEPKGAYYGGVVSAPVFKETAEYALKSLEVPSSLSKVVVAEKDFSVNTNSEMTDHAGNMFQKIGDGSFHIPDVRGKTLRDVLAAVGQANIKLKMEGSGLADSQNPSGGGIIKEGETFFVSFRQPE